MKDEQLLKKIKYIRLNGLADNLDNYLRIAQKNNFSHFRLLQYIIEDANPNSYWLTHFINQGFEIFCAFVSDETGERTANRMRELSPMVMTLRPEKRDWNDVLRSKKL